MDHNVTSSNQSGGITAHSVIGVGGQPPSEPPPKPAPEKPGGHWFWGKLVTIVLLLAAIVEIFEYLKPKNPTEEKPPSANAASVSAKPQSSTAPSNTMPPDNSNQTFNVTSNNQQGGITAGIVNIGPQPRNVSDGQLSALTETLKPFANGRLEIDINNSAEEVTRLSNRIIAAITAAGIKPQVMVAGMMISSPPAVNLQVWVRDRNNPPPLANALLKYFNENGLKVRGYESGLGGWPEANSNLTKLIVGPVAEW